MLKINLQIMINLFLISLSVGSPLSYLRADILNKSFKSTASVMFQSNLYLQSDQAFISEYFGITENYDVLSVYNTNNEIEIYEVESILRQIDEIQYVMDVENQGDETKNVNFLDFLIKECLKNNKLVAINLEFDCSIVENKAEDKAQILSEWINIHSNLGGIELDLFTLDCTIDQELIFTEWMKQFQDQLIEGLNDKNLLIIYGLQSSYFSIPQQQIAEQDNDDSLQQKEGKVFVEYIKYHNGYQLKFTNQNEFQYTQTKNPYLNFLLKVKDHVSWYKIWFNNICSSTISKLFSSNQQSLTPNFLDILDLEIPQHQILLVLDTPFTTESSGSYYCKNYIPSKELAELLNTLYETHQKKLGGLVISQIWKQYTPNYQYFQDLRDNCKYL